MAHASYLCKAFLKLHETLVALARSGWLQLRKQQLAAQVHYAHISRSTSLSLVRSHLHRRRVYLLIEGHREKDSVSDGHTIVLFVHFRSLLWHHFESLYVCVLH